MLWHNSDQSLPFLYLILGLQCLKNWRNLGIIMLRGRFRASLSSSSDESSQIFCSAPNEPWDTNIHREAVKSKGKHTQTEERMRPHQKIQVKQKGWMHTWAVLLFSRMLKQIALNKWRSLPGFLQNTTLNENFVYWRIYFVLLYTNNNDN